MRLLILILMILPGAALSQDSQHRTATQDCFCTDTVGARVDMGQSICLYVNGRAFIARCEMVLNNPAWRDTGQPCTSSGLIERLKPSPDPRGIHSKI